LCLLQMLLLSIVFFSCLVFDCIQSLKGLNSPAALAESRSCTTLLIALLLFSSPGHAAEEVLTPGNISAARESNVTLYCCLALSDAVVSLVSWSRCDGVDLVVYLNGDTANIRPAFVEKISLAADYGITLHLLGLNDTGNYCCKFHTFRFGIHEGRMLLEVTGKARKKSNLKEGLETILFLCFCAQLDSESPGRMSWGRDSGSPPGTEAEETSQIGVKEEMKVRLRLA
uniref:Ig-like domain-containing protein n=1 Tax=Nothoprocta perdicaria TaxID=30464 RepID=A0A8C6YNY7_NOTPE